MSRKQAELLVWIAAYGPDALENIASLHHASFPGVKYIISWQAYDISRIPDSLRERKDFQIHLESSTGLSHNRNALVNLTLSAYKDADLSSLNIYALIADDDLEFHEFHFQNIFDAFAHNSDCHVLTFRYYSRNFPKIYPGFSFDLNLPPKGYFVTSMEIALNISKILNESTDNRDILFNPSFGVNSHLFPSGEEDLMLERLLRRGKKARFIPLDVCINTKSTTAERIGNSRAFIETKGAVFLYLKPLSWLPRMLRHASKSDVSFLRYCRWWLSGVRKAKANHVFSDY